MSLNFGGYSVQQVGLHQLKFSCTAA